MFEKPDSYFMAYFCSKIIHGSVGGDKKFTNLPCFGGGSRGGSGVLLEPPPGPQFLNIL